MKLATYSKQPGERKDYDVDYAPWLEHDANDSLNDVQATVTVTSGTDDDGATLQVESIEITATIIKLWVSGGVNGVTYKVDLTVKTQFGRIDECELVFKVKEI